MITASSQPMVSKTIRVLLSGRCSTLRYLGFRTTARPATNILPLLPRYDREHRSSSTSRRIISSSSSSSEHTAPSAQQQPSYSPDPELVDASFAPDDLVESDNAESAVVYDNFITPEEGEALVSDLKAKLKRRRYERGHWDAVIVKYKETELTDEAAFLSENSLRVFDRVRKQLLARHFAHPEHARWLPCHAIDLHKEGELNAHVDSVRFSGEIVAGLSLLSSCIMRLQPAAEEDDNDEGGDKEEEEGDGYSYSSKKASKQEANEGHVDLLLPPLSLYVLSGVARYKYTHELLPSGAAFKNNRVVDRDHRLSVIFRDAKTEE